MLPRMFQSFHTEEGGEIQEQMWIQAIEWESMRPTETKSVRHAGPEPRAQTGRPTGWGGARNKDLWMPHSGQAPMLTEQIPGGLSPSLAS